MMAGMLKRVAPLSYEAWIDYDVCGAPLSRMELDALRGLVTVERGRLAGAAGRARPRRRLREAGPRQARDRRALREARADGRAGFRARSVEARVPAETFAERFAEAVPKVDNRRRSE